MINLSLRRCRDASGVTLAVLLISLSLAAPPSGAVEVDDLFQVVVPVTSENAAQRKAAISEAFGRVLTKVTGNRQVASRNSLSSDSKDASSYVQAYRYRTGQLPRDGEATDGRLLEVTFDRAELSRLLQRRGLPLWGTNRPGILVWMGVEQRGRQRRLLNPERDTAVRQALTRVAVERGVPLLLPLMDLEDQSQMQVADLWGDFETNIRTASRRYGPDLIITGRMSALDSGLWRGEWRLYFADKQTSWSNQAASSEALAADALQRAADQLAARFAPLRQERDLSTVRLQVSGINDLDDYARVLELLSRQESLEQVVVVAVTPDTVTYDLHGLGGTASLERSLGIGGQLESDLRALPGEDPGVDMVDLYYRLR